MSLLVGVQCVARSNRYNRGLSKYRGITLLFVGKMVDQIAHLLDEEEERDDEEDEV